MPEVQIAFEGPLGTLRGMLHRPDRPGEVPALVMLHGFTGQHVEDQRLFVQAARHFAGAGYAVLRMDFFGSGDSDGAFTDMTVHTEVADAVAMLDWLAGQPNVDSARTGVIGLSLGGAVTALLAAQDARVKAAVFWNAVGLPVLHFSEIPREGPHAGIVGGLQVSAAFLDTFYTLDIPAALAEYSGPGLVIRGTHDAIVLAREAEALAEVLGARGTLYQLERADHTFTHPAWREELFEVTTGWLAEHL